jgi:branched-subunit amino acid transport protein
MSDTAIWAFIIGMAVANYAVRLLPIAILSDLRFPEPIRRWLSHIPVAVMASLVAGEVLRPGGTWMVTPDNPYLWASLATGLIYYRFRSFLGATVAGVVCFLALRTLLG